MNRCEHVIYALQILFLLVPMHKPKTCQDKKLQLPTEITHLIQNSKIDFRVLMSNRFPIARIIYKVATRETDKSIDVFLST